MPPAPKQAPQAPKLRVMDVFERTVRSHGPKPALRVKRNGGWKSYTWDEYRHQVRMIARALMAIGAEKGSGVAIIGYNCPEWFFADVGAIYAGLVPAGIYTTCAAEQCEYIAAHCEAPVIFVEDQEQLQKLLGVRSRLPKLKALVLMRGDSQEPGVYSWTKFQELGLNTTEQALDKRAAAQQGDEPATLIYTSGTT